MAQQIGAKLWHMTSWAGGFGLGGVSFNVPEDRNGTEGVDALAGATVTSKAIFSAVEDCLSQAK